MQKKRVVCKRASTSTNKQSKGENNGGKVTKASKKAIESVANPPESKVAENIEKKPHQKTKKRASRKDSMVDEQQIAQQPVAGVVAETQKVRCSVRALFGEEGQSKEVPSTSFRQGYSGLSAQTLEVIERIKKANKSRLVDYSPNDIKTRETENIDFLDALPKKKSTQTKKFNFMEPNFTLSSPTRSTVDKVLQLQGKPATHQSLEQHYLLKVFTSVDKALNSILSMNQFPNIQNLSKYLQKDEKRMLIDLRKIKSIWSDSVTFKWVIEDEVQVLQVSNGFSNHSMGESSYSRNIAQQRIRMFEEKLKDSMEEFNEIPLAVLPPKLGKNTHKGVEKFLLKSTQESEFSSRLNTILEEQFNKKEDVSIPYSTRKDCSLGSTTCLPSDNSSSNSAFMTALLKNIQEKEENIQREKEKKLSGDSGIGFSPNELTAIASSIKSHFVQRKVHCMFLAQVVERLTKGIGSKISSLGEMSKRVDYLVSISKGWLTVMNNQEGSILKLDPSIPFSLVQDSIRNYPSKVR